MSKPGKHRRTPVRSATRRALPFAAVVLAASSAIALTGNAQAASVPAPVKVAAVDDTYSSSARPTYTFGTSRSLVAGTVSGDRMVSYLKFKVGAVPAGAAISKVELKLTAERAMPVAAVKVRKAGSTTWTEGALSYRTAPALGDEVASVTPAKGATTVTLNLTSAVKAGGTYAFAVTSAATNATARFRSAEYGTAGPQLTVTYKAAPVTNPSTPPSSSPSTPPSTPPSSSPSTPPSSSPSTPPSTDPSAPVGPCTVDAKLVPSCNLLWGAAAGGFSETPRDQALKEWEAKSGRTSTIYHTYHRGDELFPTAAEKAMARDPNNPRVLFLNWKVDYGTKWSKVAAGEQNARIDRLAAYIKANFTEKFFMTMHHEPENDVVETAGSGMTAKDYAAMFRHTVLRLKAQGVTNAVFVMAYMNYEKWNNSPWWWDLYPGDDVIDWLGVDTYNNAQPGGFHYGDFNYLMNRTTDKAKFPGWYNWATTQHPTKPIMVAEWGVYDSSSPVVETNRGKVFDTVLPQLKANFPKVKAMVYFDTAKDQNGHDIRIDATQDSLAAFQRIAKDPIWNVKVW